MLHQPWLKKQIRERSKRTVYFKTIEERGCRKAGSLSFWSKRTCRGSGKRQKNKFGTCRHSSKHQKNNLRLADIPANVKKIIWDLPTFQQTSKNNLRLAQSWAITIQNKTLVNGTKKHHLESCSMGWRFVFRLIHSFRHSVALPPSLCHTTHVYSYLPTIG